VKEKLLEAREDATDLAEQFCIYEALSFVDFAIGAVSQKQRTLEKQISFRIAGAA
jgi:hypothetical protein